MKLAPLTGEILPQLAIEEAMPYDMSQFKITLPAILKQG